MPTPPALRDKINTDGRFRCLEFADHLFTLITVGATVDVVGVVMAGQAQVSSEGIPSSVNWVKISRLSPSAITSATISLRRAEFVRSLWGKVALVL